MRKVYGFGAVALLSILVLSGCHHGEDTGKDVNARAQESKEKAQGKMSNNEKKLEKEDKHKITIDNLPIEELSEEEKEDILKMREEEKLAGDVYEVLGKKWGKNIFINIRESERTHTNEVKLLIDRYDLNDPVADNTLGVFTSPELQKLYTTLIAQGEKSLLDALIVGATIEDLDIKDLQDSLGRADNQDIAVIYTNLLEGSKKHLHSFVKNITKEGGEYVPQYISQDDYTEIVTMERVTGGKGDGKCVKEGGSGCGRHSGTGGGHGFSSGK